MKTWAKAIVMEVDKKGLVELIVCGGKKNIG